MKLTSSEAMVERESPPAPTELPTLCPFDIAVTFDHMLDEDAWRSNLKTLGIDITVVLPASKFDSAISQAARSKELFLRLREGETNKFCSGRKTDT